MMDRTYELLVSSWEMHQNLAKGFGDSCWKVRSIGIGFWAAIIGYAYRQNDVIPVLLSLCILLIFFMVETGLMRLQYKYINKSLEIEAALNDILVGEAPSLPNSGVSTNIDTPELKDFIELFRLKRWIFWLPYVFLLVVSVICILILRN